MRRLERQEAHFEQVYERWSREVSPGAIVGVAEWLLDNYYVIRRALRQIEEDLPRSYYQELPKLQDDSGDYYPRVIDLTTHFLGQSGLQINIDRLERFVSAYQEIQPLTMGETWAIPIMLRLGLIDALTTGLFQSSDGDGEPPDTHSPSLSFAAEFGPEDLVANAVLGLRAIASHPWQSFFENVSLVERILRQDPNAVYARMDFETRDRYRKQIETLAQGSAHSETAVAGAVNELASSVDQTEADEAQRRSHIGYYLIDEGRPCFEQRLDYRAAFSERLGRWIRTRSVPLYFGALLTIFTCLLVLFVGYAQSAGASPLLLLLTGALTAIPSLTIAVETVHWAVTHLLAPNVLPKMNFVEDGIPDEFPAMVVVPTFLSSPDQTAEALRQIELHYLSNPDPNLHFALLTDFEDAPHPQMPQDEKLIAVAREGVERLNHRYGRSRHTPFHLYHRERKWNPKEGVWMGWERKRGKLTEFNRLLLGEPHSFVVQVGDHKVLPDIRYVITLDADTILPRGAAPELVGTLAHPLNQVQLHRGSRQVSAGYTILQPRTAVITYSANQSFFSRIFSGDTGLDLYTRAVSDVYQDLFGEGIFVGKGIYDVRGFVQTLRDRVPENTLLSHDLFEGIHGRAALVTDIVLLEDYPPSYIAYAHRQHRWIRGDWQLLSWLGPKVPHSSSRRVPNPLSIIDRWKIIDNLRRSLLAPALAALLAAAWTLLPGPPWIWMFIALLTPAVSLVTGTAEEALRRIQEGRLNQESPGLADAFWRWALFVCFLPYEALVALDAIATVLVRMTITKRRMLQWTTAAHAFRLFGRERQLALDWQQMYGAPLSAVTLLLAVAVIAPENLSWALPLLLIWALSPEISSWISQTSETESLTLKDADRVQLRRLARKTWLYFERYVGPEDHWLPPDHYQESPRGLAAHRTSPTNIGLMMTSYLAAYDLGFVGLLDFNERLKNALDSIDALEKHRGHLLNWYDTSNLAPLLPRYISSVDSGNFAASLLVLREALEELRNAPILAPQRWEGLLDTLFLLREACAPADDSQRRPTLQARVTKTREKIEAGRKDPFRWSPTLESLAKDDLPALNREVIGWLDENSAELDRETLRRCRIWANRLTYQVHDMRRQIRYLARWVPLLSDPPSTGEAPEDRAYHNLRDRLDPTLPLGQLHARLNSALAEMESILEGALDEATSEDKPLESPWREQVYQALKDSHRRTTEFASELENSRARMESLLETMDFEFLFDRQRKIFHIGYNLDTRQFDPNYYDLLASESRITSLIAIAKGDVPQSHWLHLGRPLTRSSQSRALLSWSGTMFEYLMPALFIRHYANTLLGQSVQAAIREQIAYGRREGVPWGISESGYYRFDTALNYQYRAFGIPALGYKRGLMEDLVISPYSSILALRWDPVEVTANLDRLRNLDGMGTFGFYEALDFTTARLNLGEEYAIVRSYMAHHQGMILMSLVNALRDNVMVGRFHRDPRIQSIELLLQEQIPYRTPLDRPPEEPTEALASMKRVNAGSWSVSSDTPFPSVHYLSNGRYGLLLTNSGGGYSKWEDHDLTRWRADATLDAWGMWFYFKDRESGLTWSPTVQPLPGQGLGREVHYSPHKATYRCKGHGLDIQTEVTVPPDDDLEIRQMVITNDGDRVRKLTLSSYGEVVLGDQATDKRHPAFNKMFIESEYDSDRQTLIFRRRPRAGDEPPVYMAHALISPVLDGSEPVCETDRRNFRGRGRAHRRPLAMEENRGLTGTTGATLDPIMALSQEIDLQPGETVRLAFLTAAGKDRESLLATLGRYRDFQRIDRAFARAQATSELEMRRMELSSDLLRQYQQLLSVLLYPYPGLRAETETLSKNRRGQPALWPYAISGDYPILLVTIGNPEEIGVLRDLVKAHTYWRKRGLEIDLIILNTQEKGYAQEVQQAIRQLLERTGSDAWINRRGGIFMLREGQIPEHDQILIRTAARAIIDAAYGNLQRHLNALEAPSPPLPNLVPTRSEQEAEQSTAPVSKPEDLQFDNGFGGFTPDGSEYAIYLPPGRWTPAPWVNVIANPEFGTLLSETGGGFTWGLNSGENRLTPWRNDPVSDPPAEAIYLRDEETAAVWSPTPLPARTDMPYLVRHGNGYTEFDHSSHGLKQRMRVFVPPDEPLKVIQLQLENTWDRNRRITATYYAEWVLGTHRDQMQLYVIPEYDDALKAIFASNPYNVEFGERWAFVAASKEPHGTTGDRREFLGRLGSLDHPVALDRIGLSNTIEAGLDPCAAIQLHIDLAPGEAKEVYFLVGQSADRERAETAVRRFQTPDQVQAAWENCRSYWDRLLNAVRVRTPEPAMDVLLNRWLLYQDLSCRYWGRSALYQSSGAYGFRDQLQDVMAFIHADPTLAREHIVRAARHQFEEGDVLHWWHPPSGRGIRTNITDDLLWLPYVTAHYVRATGDHTILDEEMPFVTGEPLKADEHERYGHYSPTRQAFSLYEHCLRAIDRGTTSGPHGLPLIGSGDWNDGMNRVGIEGRGESVWLAWFLYDTMKSFAAVCRRQEDEEEAEDLERRAEEIREAVRQGAWDGNWYIRAFYDDGDPLGSHQNQECQIDSLAQSWAVLSGGGDPERVDQAMQSVRERLIREEDGLLLLFTPPFDDTPKDPGYIKGYPPGIRENGGQYTHAAIWAVWAFAEMGKGDLAEKLYRMLNPIYHSDSEEKARRYRVEPYVVAADVYSTPPHVGRGGWTWYTGSGGWLYRLGLEAILGIRREGDRLRLKPSIPRQWEGYHVRYRFGSSHYHLEVKNPHRVNGGVRSIRVDGTMQRDLFVQLEDDGEDHEVIIELGPPERE